MSGSARARRTASHDPARRPRRGATLVMVAMLMTVLLMFVGLGVDFGRMYLFRAQLVSLGDATALTSISDLRLGRQAESQLLASAAELLEANRAGDGERPSVRLEAGQWNFAQQAFVPSTWAGATSVRVTATVTADWTLARIFGSTTKTLHTTSVASFAAVRSSACMRPFLMPYGALLARLGYSAQNLSYRLTPVDLITLREMTSPASYTLGHAAPTSSTGAVIAAFSGSGNAPGNSGNAPGNSGNAPGNSGNAPGNSGNAPPFSDNPPGNSGNAPPFSDNPPGNSGNAPPRSGNAPGNSGNAPGNSGNAPGNSGNVESDLADALQPGCRTNTTLAVGDIVSGYTGNLNGGAVRQALDALCPGTGDVWNRTCSPAPSMHVPIFDDAQMSAGVMQYRVRHIGAFRLTRLSRDGQEHRIHGHFTALNASGAGDVLAEVGPVYRAALAH